MYKYNKGHINIWHNTTKSNTFAYDVITQQDKTEFIVHADYKYKYI